MNLPDVYVGFRERYPDVAQSLDAVGKATVNDEAIRQTALLAISTAGFPTAIAAMVWIDEVLAAA